MTKLRASLFAIVPLVAAATWYVGHAAPSHAATPGAATPGAAEPPRAGALIAPGRVEPIRDPVLLAFETPGRIATLEVDEGDHVAAGQVVARLDDRLPHARLDAAKAAEAAATARLALARRGPRREELDAAKAEVAAAVAAAANRTVEQARSTRLGDLGAVPASAVDADTTSARVATASADAARARYAALVAGTRRETIDEAVAAVDAARADRAAAEVALDQTLLRAPAAGTVLRRLVEPGTLVAMLTPVPVISVADLAALEIRAEVDEADIARITTGATAFATADAYGDRRFPLHVTRLTRELGRKTVRDDDPRARIDTRVLEVVATFDTPTELPLGLRMTVHLPD